MMVEEKSWWEYLEEAEVKVILSCKDWKLWIEEEEQE